MNSAKRALLLIGILFLLGVWGCSQYPASIPSAGTARIRDLEARNARLEEDYQGAVANRDQARKKAAALEESMSQHQAEFQQILKDRDELRKQIALRVGERDAMQANLVQFSKDLQTLLGRIDAAVNLTPPPTTLPTTTAGS